MMKRKLMSIICIATVTASLLAGCAQPAPATAPTPEAAAPVTIEFMHSQPEEERVAVIQEIIDAFQAANPDVVVKQVPVPEDGYGTKLTTLISGGKLPAIVEGSIDQARMLGSQEVTDGTASAEVIETVGKDKFYKGSVNVLQSETAGEYYAVPVSGWVQGIWYRKDLFAEKGLAEPNTWENILAAAKALNDPAAKKYGIVFATEVSDFTEQTFSQFALSNNAVLFTDDGKASFNTPEMKEAVGFYKDLYQYCVPGSNGTTQVKDAFLGGNAAMAIYSTYIMGSLYEQGMADKIGFAVPENKNPAGFGMMTSLAVSNTISAEERAAAVRFISFMLDQEMNIKWLHMSPGGANPVLWEVASNDDYLSHEVLKAFGDTSSKVPNTFENLSMFGFQNGKGFVKMGDISGKMIIPRALNNILVQNADVDAEMSAAQKAMEETLQ